MKDRFRFRIWDTEKKELIYDAEKAYDYMRPCSGVKIIGADCFGDVLENKRYIVEQCTGLKDKNRNLIYENDIIKITGDILPVDPTYMDCLFKAIWTDVGFCLETLNGKDGLDFCECWKYEVIGNIHENPELLEGHDDENRFKFRAWDKILKSYLKPVNFVDLERALKDKDILIEQCTGLKDKNNKLIYEGDVVFYGGVDLWWVVFREKYCSFELLRKDGKGVSMSSHKEMVVIGNVHESSELLERKKWE